MTLTGAADADRSDEKTRVSHRVEQGSAADTGLAPVAVTVLDDDRAGARAMRLHPAELTVAEGGSADYEARWLPSSIVYEMKLSLEVGNPALLSVNSEVHRFPSASRAAGQIAVTRPRGRRTATRARDHPPSRPEVREIDRYIGHTDPVTVTIADDDAAGVAVNRAALSVAREGSAVYLAELRTRPHARVTVRPVSADPALLTTSPAELVFETWNWDVPQQVTVTGMGTDDPDAEDQLVTVRHEVAGYTVTGHDEVTEGDTVTVTVIDGDEPGLAIQPPTLAIGEAGSARYTVALKTRPSGTVTVTPLNPDASLLQISPPSLTFSPGNWQNAQPVTVSGVADADTAESTATIVHAVAGYAGVASPASVKVTVTDNGAAGVTVSKTELAVSEGSAGAAYTVVLDTQPGGTGRSRRAAATRLRRRSALRS